MRAGTGVQVVVVSDSRECSSLLPGRGGLACVQLVATLGCIICVEFVVRTRGIALRLLGRLPWQCVKLRTPPSNLRGTGGGVQAYGSIECDAPPTPSMFPPPAPPAAISAVAACKQPWLRCGSYTEGARVRGLARVHLCGGSDARCKFVRASHVPHTESKSRLHAPQLLRRRDALVAAAHELFFRQQVWGLVLCPTRQSETEPNLLPKVRGGESGGSHRANVRRDPGIGVARCCSAYHRLARKSSPCRWLYSSSTLAS
jgi:hypothetical protein